MSHSSRSRREFLAGKAARDLIERAGDELADRLADGEAPSVPSAGDTVRLETTAMACHFSVILNPGPHDRVPVASAALEMVHEIEDQLSVFREHSDLSRVNRLAADGPVKVDRALFDLLVLAARVARETDGAFDPTAGPLVDLWRACRGEERIPSESEIGERLQQTGIAKVELNDDADTIRFRQNGMELNAGGFGKGYTLDRMSEHLVAGGVGEWLLHGGHSSLLARGDHADQGGWPVGVGNPLFTEKRLGTLLLCNRAMATSGSNIQYFRHGGRRYGHILDPRTGWPADNLLSATALAPTAAQADALSTAFFVLGVENARRCCDNLEDAGAILVPQPAQGRRIQPVLINVPDEIVFWDPDQVTQSREIR